MAISIRIDRRLPDTQVYACSKRDAKAGLSGLDEAEVHFGQHTHYEFDAGCSKRPELIGSVAAMVTVDRERAVSVDFYPLAAADFLDRETRLFVATELPAMVAWTRAFLDLPETQVVSNQQLIVESVVDGFRRHEVSFL